MTTEELRASLDRVASAYTGTINNYELTIKELQQKILELQHENNKLKKSNATLLSALYPPTSDCIHPNDSQPSLPG